MANQPHKNTVTVSFTLPQWLNDKIEARAELELTNKSDIIRRALVAHVGGYGIADHEKTSSKGHGDAKVAEDEKAYGSKKSNRKI